MPLADSDIKEQLSKAYVRAVVARCGFRCMPPDPDRAGDDLLVDTCGKMPGGKAGVILRLQLKATAKELSDGDFTFRIERRLYDILRDPDREGTFLLVVYVMPLSKPKWLTSDEASLVARTCAYWAHLRGLPASTNAKITVTVKRRNVFNVRSLREIMRRLSRDQEVGDEL